MAHTAPACDIVSLQGKVGHCGSLLPNLIRQTILLVSEDNTVGKNSQALTFLQIDAHHNPSVQLSGSKSVDRQS